MKQERDDRKCYIDGFWNKEPEVNWLIDVHAHDYSPRSSCQQKLASTLKARELRIMMNWKNDVPNRTLSFAKSRMKKGSGADDTYERSV